MVAVGEGEVRLEREVEVDQAGHSGHDGYPFFLRTARSLSMVERKTLEAVMSRAQSNYVYNYFIPELLFILVVMCSYLVMCVLLSEVLISPSLVVCDPFVLIFSTPNSALF